MLDIATATVKDWGRRTKEAFGDKKPHFNFITVHCASSDLECSRQVY